ncbi:defective proboscis extension response 7 [Carabus blaptoides fortunei]
MFPVGSLAGVSPSSSGSGDTVRTVVERPYFVDAGPRNVTAILGQPAILNCRVKHPGERTMGIVGGWVDVNIIRTEVVQVSCLDICTESSTFHHNLLKCVRASRPSDEIPNQITVPGACAGFVRTCPMPGEHYDHLQS